MPGIDSPWMAEVAGSGATVDVLAGVLDALPGEREHPAAALTNTQPTAIATRTGCVVTNDMHFSSRTRTDPKVTAAAAVTSGRSDQG
jgi:hypothetical protein